MDVGMIEMLSFLVGKQRRNDGTAILDEVLRESVTNTTFATTRGTKDEALESTRKNSRIGNQ